jgi:4-amino-4-deoxy-L-arabinose transferase-like glycosyltransferase
MAGGLLLRLFLLGGTLYSDTAPLTGDEPNYVGIASHLARGEGFIELGVWTRPPAYPLFLAAFIALTDGTLAPAMAAQMLISVATIGMVYLLALEVLAYHAGVPHRKARPAATAAAGLMAFNPHLIFMSSLFLTETLYTFFLSVMLWAILRGLRLWMERAPSHVGANALITQRRPAVTMVLLAGVAAGLAALTRSLLVTFIPFVLGWCWWVMSRRPASKAHTGRWAWVRSAAGATALFVLACAAVVLPWTVRNYLTYNRFLLVDTTGGYNLWLYNGNISKDEIHRRLLEIRNPVDRERYAVQQALQAIAADVPGFLQSAASRFADAWRPEEFQELRISLRDQYPGTDCTNLDIYGWAQTLFYVGLVLLTVWGMAVGPGRAFKGLFALALVHYALTTMLIFAGFRFRVPLYPFASVYAGWMLVNPGLFGRLRPGDRARRDDMPRTAVVARAGAVLLSVAFLAQAAYMVLPEVLDSIRFERRYIEGKIRMDKGDFAGALAQFTGAAQIDRECACLHRYIGLAYGRLGEPDKERAAYQAALAPEEHDWRTRALLSDRLRAAGDPRAAVIIRNTAPPFRAEQLRWAWDNIAPPPTPELDVGGADIGYLKGFEAAETEPTSSGQVTYRWTGAHAYLRLWPASGPDGVRLVLHWHSLAWPGKLEPTNTVRVLVNGVEAGTLTAFPGWHEAALDIPATMLASDGYQPFVIELLTSTARPPGEDRRLLGVAIDYVKLLDAHAELPVPAAPSAGSY